MTFIDSWISVFLLAGAPLDVHIRFDCSYVSDCRHNGNWYTVHEAVRFGNILFLLHLNKSSSAAILRTYSEISVVQRQLCARARKDGDQSR